MDILRILIFSFGVLLIILGISIFTPFISWIGKKISHYQLSFLNYNQSNSIRITSILLGIILFIFGIFLTIASAALSDIWNPSIHQNSLQPKSSTPKVEIFQTPMVPGKKLSVPNINPKPTVPLSEYRLNCPSDVDGLNMRKAAGLNTEIIILIPCNAIGIKDTKQRYYEDGVEWYLVKYQQKTGWVAGKYLKPQATKPSKTIVFSRLIAKKRP